MSCFNWNRIYNFGELQYLTKGEIMPCSEIYIEKYYTLYQKFINEFGFPDNVKTMLEMKHKALKHYTKFLITSNFNEKLKGDLIMIELDKESKGKDMKFHEQIVLISKYLGYQINPKKFSAWEYLSTINTIAEHGS